MCVGADPAPEQYQLSRGENRRWQGFAGRAEKAPPQRRLIGSILAVGVIVAARTGWPLQV
jgi:hypothetical protein